MNMFRFSWGVTLAFTLATLTGILIVTSDLAETNSVFKDGVVQAETVNATTDTALGAANELNPANDAISGGIPHVAGTLASLGRAQHTLGTLATQLQALADTLGSADKPLTGIIAAGKASTKQANAAESPAESIVGTLRRANARVNALAPRLDRTVMLSKRIESKLHILLFLPQVG